MVDILLIFWGVGLIISLLGLIGISFHLISLYAMLSSNAKKGLLYIFITSVLVLSYTVIVIYFGYIKQEITEKLWILITALYVFVGISWTMGIVKLYKVIQEAENKN